MIPWHSPLITPAQGAMIFAACLSVYVVARVVAWFLSEPEQDAFAEPHGDVPHTGGRS